MRLLLSEVLLPAQIASPADQPKIPTGYVDSIARALQQAMGGGPISTYVLWFFVTAITATLLALQNRGSLFKEWYSVGPWRDKIPVVIAARSTAQGRFLEFASLGALTLAKGTIVLDHPGAVVDQIVSLNKRAVAVARRGEMYDVATEALCGPLGFVTAAILHTALFLLLVSLDSLNLTNKQYTPILQNWLLLILLWPACGNLLLHGFFPSWRREYDGLKVDLDKISADLDFKDKNLETVS